MKAQKKHRLIGGLVVLAILAIFLPIIFRHSKPVSEIKLSAAIPPAPPPPQIELDMKSAPKPDAPAVPAALAVAGDPPAATVTEKSAPVQHLIAQEISSSPNKEEIIIKQAKAQTVAAPVEAVTKQGHIKVKEKVDLVSKPVATKPPLKTNHKKMVSHHHHLKRNQKLQKALHVPNAWSVQLASFSRKANALVLVKRLRAKGYDVYLRESVAKYHHQFFRVYVGPVIRHKRANRIQEELQREFRLVGVVRKYEV